MDGVSISTRNSGIVNSIPLSDILRPGFSGGRIAVPVDSSSPFTSFKYVAGVPTAQDGTGYPMSKLQALDVLIGRLVALRQEGLMQGLPSDISSLSEETLGALIKDLGQKINVAMTNGIDGLQDRIGVHLGAHDQGTGVILDTYV